MIRIRLASPEKIIVLLPFIYILPHKSALWMRQIGPIFRNRKSENQTMKKPPEKAKLKTV